LVKALNDVGEKLAHAASPSPRIRCWVAGDFLYAALHRAGTIQRLARPQKPRIGHVAQVVSEMAINGGGAGPQISSVIQPTVWGCTGRRHQTDNGNSPMLRMQQRQRANTTSRRANRRAGHPRLRAGAIGWHWQFKVLP
jgi:hypothetical protein